MSDDPAAEDDDVALPPVPARPRMVITQPGIYEMEAEDYHADPCPEPSLSRSVLKKLLARSPRHAYIIHPKLGGLDDADDTGNDAQDFGTAAHASFLQNRSIITRLDFRDWKTKKAKEARAQAYADGMIPLLTRSYNRSQRIIDALEDFRAKTGAFTQGKPEQTIAWRDGPTWCRARFDWLPDNPEAAPWDLKTTDGAATLTAWSRAAFDKGADLQDSFYCRGLECVRGEPPSPMKFAVVEQKPPYAIAVFEMSPVTRDLADEDVRAGLIQWEACIETGLWPPYTWETQWIDPPAWVVRERQNQGALTARNLDLLRGRDHPNAEQYIRTGDFGG